MLISDSDYLNLALKQAKRYQGECAPNPAVGAVCVKNQMIIAKGTHCGPGRNHAEIDAFHQTTPEALEGAVLYVTLEPCNHHGRTPPCTHAIINAKIARVCYGLSDPNPEVRGHGAERLKQAGIQVEQVELPEINKFYEAYCYWHQHKLPFVTAKLAMSLDGKVAGASRAPAKITSDEANAFTHQQRKKTDAILTTAYTINHDNPLLNARIDNEIFPKPIYIIDSQKVLNLQSKIFQTARRVNIFHADNIDYPLNETYKTCPLESTKTGLNLKKILQYIGKDGIQNLWVEAGPQLFHSLHHQRCVNRTYLYIAPKYLGHDAVSAFTRNYAYDLKGAKISWHLLGVDSCCQLDWEF